MRGGSEKLSRPFSGPMRSIPRMPCMHTTLQLLLIGCINIRRHASTTTVRWRLPKKGGARLVWSISRASRRKVASSNFAGPPATLRRRAQSHRRLGRGAGRGRLMSTPKDSAGKPPVRLGDSCSKRVDHPGSATYRAARTEGHGQATWRSLAGARLRYRRSNAQRACREPW